MTAASIALAPVATEGARVLLIGDAARDERGARMLRLARALLEDDGVAVDQLDPQQHPSSDVYEKWLFADAVIAIAPAGASTIATRFRPAIDRMARAGYPARLAERAYGVVVHGDGDAAEQTRRALCGWFDGLGMVDSDSFAILDRYLGYHEAHGRGDQGLKLDDDYLAEVRNVARAVATAVLELRAGHVSPPERRARLA
jgi:hypothetical protein